MRREQIMVSEFHRKFSGRNPPAPGTYAFPSEAAIKLRLAMLREEVNELEEACAEYSFLRKDVADAIGDILYVALGAAVEWGLDIEPIFAEIHRSNMSKSAVKDANGKVTKGPGYSPPNLEPFLTIDSPVTTRGDL